MLLFLKNIIIKFIHHHVYYFLHILPDLNDDVVGIDDFIDDGVDHDYDSDDDFFDDSTTQVKSIKLDLSNGSPIDGNNTIFVHFNINSILSDNKIEQLTDVTSTLKVDCLMITESKLDITIPSNLILINGFHPPLRADRNRHGGGCLIYIKDTYTFKHLTHLQSDLYEHLCVDIIINGSVYTVNTLYRPPNESVEQHGIFLREMEAILTRLSAHKSDNIIISSDLNFGNTYCVELPLPPKPLDNTAPDIFSSFGFNQLIDVPTRVSAGCISLIDLFFTNNSFNLVCNGTIPPIADHEGVFASFIGKKN